MTGFIKGDGLKLKLETVGIGFIKEDGLTLKLETAEIGAIVVTVIVVDNGVGNTVFDKLSVLLVSDVNGDCDLLLFLILEISSDKTNSSNKTLD